VPACDANLGQVSEGLRMMRREWTHSVELPNKALQRMIALPRCARAGAHR
jgi:hypothetical protein